MFFKSKKGSVANSIPELDAVDGKPAPAPMKPPSAPIDKGVTQAALGAASKLNGQAPVDAPASAVTPAPAAPSAPVTDVDLSKGAAISKRIEAALGEIVAILMRSEQHQSMTLSDLRTHVLPGILLGQFSLAEAQSKVNGMTTPVGVVIWASVSEEVDKKLAISEGPVPALAASDWNSGPIPWVQIAVGDQRLVGAILENLLKQAWAGKKAKIRIKGPDGKVAISMLEAKPATGAAAG